jgi:glycosyltransferase involved in cell wall biosynthesis
LVESLLAQTLKPSEILIADGGSTDRTVEVVERLIAKGDPVRLVRERRSLPGRSRNVGARNARFDWIAFTDAGNVAEPNWLENLARNLSNGSVDVVYGSYEPVIDTFFKECAAIAYVPPLLPTENGDVRPTSIVSALMRRRVWESVNGFPEDLRSAEDLLFMRAVERAGFRIKREPAAIVHWQIQPTLWRTFKRFTEYSRNNIRAGLWREWQAAIFLRYGLLLLFCLPAIFLGWRWLLIPIATLVSLLLARAVHAIRRNQIQYPAAPVHNLARLCWLVPIVAVIDAAAILGSLKWLMADAFRSKRERTK